MTLNDYFEPRVFRSPYLQRTESVRASAALWALLLGPAYYWRKQAPLEALILTVLDAMLMLMPSSIVGIAAGNDLLGMLIWLGFGVGAPVLLPMCYRRKGWVEIGRSAEARWLSGSLERRSSRRAGGLTEGSGSRLSIDRGESRNRLPLR